RGDADLFRELASLGETWATLAERAAARRDEFLRLVAEARSGRPVRTKDADDETASLEDKARRIVRLESRHGVHFTPEQLAEHGETAVRAAFYTRVRAEERNAVG